MIFPATRVSSTIGLSICIALATLSLSGCDQERNDVSRPLLESFGSTCMPVGAWTQSAMRQNQALYQAFDSLTKKENNPCAPYMSSLMAIQSSLTQANRLLSDNNYLQYRASQEQVQDLALVLSSPPADTDLVAALKMQLIAAQVDLYQRRAMDSATRSLSEKNRYAQATSDLSSYLQTVIAAQEAGGGGLAACLKAYPEAAVGIAGNLLALGGSFASPTLGAGLAVVGGLLSAGVEYVSHSSTADAIWDLNGALVPTALTCGLESMTELYCDAEDAFALLELKKKSTHNSNESVDPIWSGLELLTDRMPALNTWLLEVKNGVAPTDPVLAAKQNLILDKMNLVDKTQNSVYATLIEQEQIWRDSPDQQKSNVMLNAIETELAVIGFFSSSSTTVPNPYMELSTDTRLYACWVVKGPKADCEKPGDTESSESYIRSHLLKMRIWSSVIERAVSRSL